jgi:hypothetical protein
MHKLAQLNTYCCVSENKMYVVEDNIQMDLTVTFYVYENIITRSIITYKEKEGNINLREIRSEKLIDFTSYHMLMG